MPRFTAPTVETEQTMGAATSDLITSAWTLGGAVLFGMVLEWFWNTTHHHR